MSEYDDAAVNGEQYCMPSMQKSNVDSMNKAMGYENMSDRANTPKAPTKMMAEKSNKQLSPQMPGSDSFNYDKRR